MHMCLALGIVAPPEYTFNRPWQDSDSVYNDAIVFDDSIPQLLSTETPPHFGKIASSVDISPILPTLDDPVDTDVSWNVSYIILNIYQFQENSCVDFLFLFLLVVAFTIMCQCGAGHTQTRRNIVMVEATPVTPNVDTGETKQ